MDSEQYVRWVDFAARMARVCYARSPRTAAEVRDFIAGFAPVDRNCMSHGSYLDVSSWDASASGCDSVSTAADTWLWERRPDSARSEAGFARWCDTGWACAFLCCVRAGLDLAAEPSAGVVGFDLGALRRMYPDGIPAWITEQYVPTDLATLPDSAGVWL